MIDDEWHRGTVTLRALRCPVHPCESQHTHASAVRARGRMSGRDAPASPLCRTGETAAPPCGLGSDSEYDYEAATRCSDECEAHSGSNSADDVSCAESEACEGEEEEEEDEGAYAVGALSARARAAFSVLDEGGLRERLTDSVSSVVSVLSCSPDEALLLLRTYKFNSARVSEEWFQARLGGQSKRRCSC